MVNYGRNLDLEEDLHEKVPETMGVSYAPVDKEIVRSFKQHYSFLTPEEFAGGGAKTKEGKVLYDSENGKAAYVKLSSHSGDMVLFNTHFFGEEKEVVEYLSE